MKATAILVFVFFSFNLNGQNLAWVKTFGSELGLESVLSIYVKNDKLICSGQFETTVDFDPGTGISTLTSFGIADGFIASFDTNGIFNWVKQIGGTDYDLATKVMIGINGDIYVMGSFRGTVDFDPGPGIYNLTAPGFWENPYILK